LRAHQIFVAAAEDEMMIDCTNEKNQINFLVHRVANYPSEKVLLKIEE